MDIYAVYNSPFRSSVYTSTQVDTVRHVYRQRITDLYHKAYPSLLEVSEDTLSTEEQTEEESKQDGADQGANGVDNEEKGKGDDIEKAVEEIKEDDVDKEVVVEKENGDKEDGDNEENENKEEKKGDTATESKEETEEIAISEEEKKLNHALKLLDTEYFGNEHVLYERVFAKYGNGQSLAEYSMDRYSTPLISEVLQSKHESIVCSECLQEYAVSEFPVDEFDHGYYLACSRCAPDRNTEISLKWHPQFKSDSVILSDNGYVAKVTQSNHRYVTADQRPVTKGIHCWRWCTRHYQSWFLWGISHSKKHTDSSYGNQGVFGIAGSNQSYKNGQCT